MSSTAPNMPSPQTTRPAIWISPALHGQTKVAIEHGGNILRPYAFAAQGKLMDLVERLVHYADTNRAADGTVTVWVEADGGGAQTIVSALNDLPDCTARALTSDAPALTVLHEILARAEKQGMGVLPTMPQVVERELVLPPILGMSVGAESGPVTGMTSGAAQGPRMSDIEAIPAWQPLSQPTTGNNDVGPGGARSSANTVLGAARSPDVIGASSRAEAGAMGMGGMGGGRTAHDVIRMGGNDPGNMPAPPPKEPSFARALPPPAAPPASPPQMVAMPMVRMPPPPAPPSIEVTTAPMLSPGSGAATGSTSIGGRVARAARNVATEYRGLSTAYLGADPEVADPAHIFLWVLSAGLGHRVLADPALAGERLRTAASVHKDAIQVALGTSWAEVENEDIALWMAEQRGAGTLPEASSIALEDYKRSRRR